MTAPTSHQLHPAAINTPSIARRLAPCVPYLAVLVGMYWLHSACVALLAYHLGVAGLLTLERQWPRGVWAGFVGWQAPVAVLGGVGTGAVLYLCWPLLGAPREMGGQLAGLGLTPAAWPFFMLYFVLVNPWLEECGWRGLLGSTSRMPTWHDLLFAGYHILVLASFFRWPWLLLSLCALTAAGWAWRQVARCNGGLLIPVISHMLADAGIVLAIYLRK